MAQNVGPRYHRKKKKKKEMNTAPKVELRVGGQRGEMAQTIYAHMNKRIKKKNLKKKKVELKQGSRALSLNFISRMHFEDTNISFH
jgi:hypothetical protein